MIAPTRLVPDLDDLLLLRWLLPILVVLLDFYVGCVDCRDFGRSVVVETLVHHWLLLDLLAIEVGFADF